MAAILSCLLGIHVRDFCKITRIGWELFQDKNPFAAAKIKNADYSNVRV